jgi:hypothetical protein
MSQPQIKNDEEVLPISEEFCEELSGYGCEELDSMSLAAIWADIITGRDKQDVTVLIVSEKGAGKSHTAIKLAVDTAKEVAKRVGGKWQDYFPFDPVTKELPNVACIDLKDIVTLVGSMKLYNVYIFDDIGVGLNSRRWQTDTNIIVNDVLEICRTSRACSIFTVMDASFIDKVVREILAWHLEISESRHADGYNVLKVLRAKKQFRTGKMHRVYIKRNNTRLIRCIVEGPTPELAEAYDALRSRKTKELMQDRLDQFLGEESKPKVSKREQNLQEDLTKYAEKLTGLKQEGATVREMVRNTGLSPGKINKLLAYL